VPCDGRFELVLMACLCLGLHRGDVVGALRALDLEHLHEDVR
jgi:hypothetical protein